jgi:3-oxoacyl-[acyl-carrier protein] reductase
MSKPLADKIALVTGASRGIGRAIAIRLGADGALVAIHYARNRGAAEPAVREIERTGGRAFPIAADLGSVATIDKLFEQLDQELSKRTGSKRFDILINNAAISPDTPVDTTDEKLFDEVFDLNAKAPFFISQKALPRLKDGGRIINISSGVTRIALPQVAAYAMTKGALDVLTLELAKQLGPRGITVNSLAPGVTNTDMNKDRLSDPQFRHFAVSISALGRIGQPEDIAGAAVFLASDDSRWVTGQYLDATGGAQL